jgi:hypothetical protein
LGLSNLETIEQFIKGFLVFALLEICTADVEVVAFKKVSRFHVPLNQHAYIAALRLCGP